MPTVYITAPNDAAADIAETLVSERLVACVNRLPIQSTYRWEGEIHHDDEVLLLAKTSDEAYDAVVEQVRSIHPYDVPCIERLDEGHVLEAYANWRDDAVDP